MFQREREVLADATETAKGAVTMAIVMAASALLLAGIAIALAVTHA
jgi:hypothetical protein